MRHHRLQFQRAVWPIGIQNALKPFVRFLFDITIIHHVARPCEWASAASLIPQGNMPHIARAQTLIYAEGIYRIYTLISNLTEMKYKKQRTIFVIEERDFSWLLETIYFHSIHPCPTLSLCRTGAQPGGVDN